MNKEMKQIEPQADLTPERLNRYFGTWGEEDPRQVLVVLTCPDKKPLWGLWATKKGGQYDHNNKDQANAI